jgi:hypothetical protein
MVVRTNFGKKKGVDKQTSKFNQRTGLLKRDKFHIFVEN